jgi:hypothetical protein
MIKKSFMAGMLKASQSLPSIALQTIREWCVWGRSLKMDTNITSEEEIFATHDRDVTAAETARMESPQLPSETAAAFVPRTRTLASAGVNAWGSVRYSGLFGCLAALLLLTGCADFTMTNPPRTFTEQLLLSTAADRALRAADLSTFSGKKVFIDFTYFDGYDPKYVQGSIRDTFSQAGALLVAAEPGSDYVVEARSGAYSIDFDSSLIGIPPFGLPIPLAGTISTPELAFYKSSKQHSLAKFALLAFDTKTREHFYSSGPIVGKAFNNNHKVFGFLWISTDIPEKKKKH